MDDDGQVRDVHVRHARGTAPNMVAVEQGIARNASAVVQIPQRSTSDEPARSINEAVERWIVARELDDGTRLVKSPAMLAE